jgi:guanylate kinase
MPDMDTQPQEKKSQSPIKVQKGGRYSSSTSKSSSFSISKSSSSSTNSETPQTRQVLRPLVICGPSGVGKGTIISKYMKEYNHAKHHKFGFTVSHTTRDPRPGEIDGVHYNFTTKSQMEESIRKNLFLEYAHVHGNIYGTSLDSLSLLEENGQIPLLDIDVQGVMNIKKRQEEDVQNSHDVPELQAKYIFIAPPSLDLLLQRLTARGTETEESIQRRTKNAIAEMEYGMMDGNFDAVIVNDDLNQACIEFSDVIDELYQ